MAESLQAEDFEGKRNSLKYAIFGLFFLGLFLAALGLGLFLFKNQKEDEIQIISAQSAEKPNLAVLVHVDGAVAKSGVYEIASGGRVKDAVDAAGGLTGDADLSKINLAAKVVDGQKIMVPFVGQQETLQSNLGQASNKGQGINQSSLININTATEAELDKLPGIGPATAKKIVALRPYSSPDELLSKRR